MERTRGTVLVVDDDGRALLLMRLLLEHAGYVVVAVDGGPAALAQLDAGLAPDIVLLDLRMPGMDGYELLRRLRDHPLGRVARRILCTAMADELTRIQALASGADYVLTKPFGREELVTALASPGDL